MKATRLLIPLLLGSVLPGGPRAFADLVDDWFLSTAVRDGVTGNLESSSFFVVINPFNSNHSAANGNSVSSASYSLAWSEQAQTGTFHIATSQDLAGTPSGTSFADTSGFIWIRPSVSLTMTLSGRYNYDLNADPMSAALSLAVIDADDPNNRLFGETRVFNTLFGGSMGQHAIDGQITIPPGRTWRLSYLMRSLASAGTGGSLSHANGTVDFAFVPVPQPATGLLAAAALPVLLRRRRRRR